MKPIEPTRARIPAGARLSIVACLGLGLAVAKPWMGDRPGRQAPSPTSAEAREFALACLGAGECRPAIGELDDRELEEILAILARLVSSYGERDFGSFLALRHGDLDSAEQRRDEDRGELRALCVELGTPEGELPDDWTGLLETYWHTYYREPPVSHFRPENTLVVLHREGLGAHSLGTWEAEFEALVAARQGARLRHRMMVPHRRSIEQVARDFGPLRWLDVQLAFVAHDAAEGWLVARFAWDGRVGEWFLHRATTVLDGELRDDRRHLVL